jgi:uncharacterized protein YkwD
MNSTLPSDRRPSFSLAGRLCRAVLLLQLGGLGVLGLAGAQVAEAGAAKSCPSPAEIHAELLRLNAFRTQAQACGRKLLPAAPPLRWEGRLEASALAFAAELAQGDQLSHVGLKGSSLRERFRQSGYVMRRAGENLAAGQESLDEVLATWTLSAQHCENLMQSEFVDVGLACVVGPGRYDRYWVLHLGRPVEP